MTPNFFLKTKVSPPDFAIRLQWSPRSQMFWRLYTTQTGCVGCTIAVVSSIRVFSNPVEDVMVNFEIQIRSCIFIWIQNFFEYSNDSFSLWSINDKGGTSVEVSWKFEATDILRAMVFKGSVYGFLYIGCPFSILFIIQLLLLNFCPTVGTTTNFIWILFTTNIFSPENEYYYKNN